MSREELPKGFGETVKHSTEIFKFYCL